jgi:hypothetical protein
VKLIAAGLAALALAGCGRPPDGEIVSTFRAFVSAVETGDTQKQETIAPFLATLAPDRRAQAVAALRALAAGNPGMRVARGAGTTWLLEIPRDGTTVSVPFRRDARGRWEMSPILESTLHLDFVPARKQGAP